MQVTKLRLILQDECEKEQPSHNFSPQETLINANGFLRLLSNSF